MESSNHQLRDNDVRSMFRKLHLAYAEVVCNPFYELGEKIESKKYNEVVKGMLVEKKNDYNFAL